MEQQRQQTSATAAKTTPSRQVGPLHDDQIQIETRVVAGLVIAVLLLAFAILYVYPDDTAQRFSWTVTPLFTPMLMGAGYLAGAYFFLRVLVGRKWHEVALGFLPITSFTILMILATLLHLDRFHHGTFGFYLWTVIYIITPFLVPYLWWRNRARDTGKPDALDYLIPRNTRLALAIVGTGGILICLASFVYPGWAIANAPWKLSPLTARVSAGWAVLMAATVLSAASDARWSSLRVLLQSAMIGGALMFLALVRAWGDLNPSNPLTWLLAVGFPLSVVGLAIIHVAVDTRRRSQPV